MAVRFIIEAVLPSLHAELTPGPLALFKQARLTECVEQLRAPSSSDDALLYAEALLCLGRPNEVVRVDLLKLLAEVPANRRYVAQSLLAAGFFRSGMTDQGEQSLKAAYDSLKETTDPNARHWVDYRAAREYWGIGEGKHTERLLRSIPMNKGVLAARSLALLSWVEGSRYHFHEQIRLLRKAWDALPLHEDVHTGAKILHALSHLSWELYSPELAQFVEQAEAKIPWSEDLAFEHVEVLRSIAWTRAMQGRIVPALRQLRANERLLANPATQMLAIMDRARIAHACGEMNSYRAFLQEAEALSHRVDWARTTNEERFGLLVLSALFAPEDPDYARSILARYQQIVTPVTITVSWGNGDIRREAAECYTIGVIARFQHRPTEAIANLRRAFSIYKRIGYLWRACLCAYHLNAISAAPDLMECAVIWIREHFPHAWFAQLFDAARKLDADPEYAKLSRAQREVLHLLLRGYSPADIAEELEREPKTIRNHITGIFRVFGVHRREELEKLFATRGLS